MATPRSGISDAEREVLKLLWDQGPMAVRDLMDRLAREGSQWARTTVITLLGRLEAKGYVKSDKRGHAHVFRATASRAEVLRQRLIEVADQFCDGDAGPLVMALVKGGRLKASEIAALRQLVEEKQTGWRAGPEKSAP
jgi:predicted transcriptional regulator